MSKKYPHLPGHRGIDTSVAVSKKCEKPLRDLRNIVLEAIKKAGPLGISRDELFALPQIAARNPERSTVSARISELRADGKVRDSKYRIKNHNNNSVIVWVACDA